MIHCLQLQLFAYTAFSVNQKHHCIHKMLPLVWILQTLWTKKSFKLYITFSIGFIRYILTDGKWLRSFAHLCLLSLHKVHIPLPQVKAEEHARIVLVTDSLGLLSIIFVH